MKTVTAYANTNIAFIKYWGKVQGERALARNLPAVGSISMTLDDIGSKTKVAPAERDAFSLNGVEADGVRVFEFLDRVAQELSVARTPLRVTSENTVPTAAGLASSASAFCALGLAASRAFGVALDARTLSGLCRQGSASAARSVFGGFVELPASTGDEVYASSLMESWDIRLIVAKTTTREKSVHSRKGMQHTAHTSTYYPAWLADWRRDFDAGKKALLSRDLQALGEAMEHSTLAMHATTMAARPPFLYWNGATVDCLHAIWELRQNGVQAYCTADAGPHVKVLCAPDDAERVSQTLLSVPGVLATKSHRPGTGAVVLEEVES
jgi:diphosphomevalonate decarboxylase